MDEQAQKKTSVLEGHWVDPMTGICRTVLKTAVSSKMLSTLLPNSGTPTVCVNMCSPFQVSQTGSNSYIAEDNPNF